MKTDAEREAEIRAFDALKDDETFVDATKACGEMAHDTAEAQAEEEIPMRAFMWGFWLGAVYERLGRIRGVEKCMEAGNHGGSVEIGEHTIHVVKMEKPETCPHPIGALVSVGEGPLVCLACMCDVGTDAPPTV